MRDWQDIIKLIKLTDSGTSDVDGNTIYNSVEREVFARRESIRANDFSANMQHNIKLEYKFIIYEFEYASEQFVEFENVVYEIVRTYQLSKDYIELFVKLEQGA